VPDLKKVGEQVAAGNFSDLWKGSVAGRDVSVKVMRLFQTSDIVTLLKVSNLSCDVTLLLIVLSRNSAEKRSFGVSFLTQTFCLSSAYIIWGRGSAWFRRGWKTVTF
jgi:hypothetical protein